MATRKAAEKVRLTPSTVRLKEYATPEGPRLALMDESGRVIAKLPAKFALGASTDGGEPPQFEGPAPLDSKRVLKGVRPYTYRYKPEAAKKFGEDTRRRPGVMAQAMQKSSPETRAAVIPTREGLMLDGKKSLGVALGTLPDLRRRLNRIQAAMSGKPQRGEGKK